MGIEINEINENLEKSARNGMFIIQSKQYDLEKLRKTVNTLIVPDINVCYHGQILLAEVIAVSCFFP